MISYQPVQYRPLRYAPSVQIRPGLRIELGQQAPSAGVTPGQIKAITALAGTAMLALSAATIWVGVNTGLSRKGLLGIAGWGVAAAAGIAGLVDLVTMLGIISIPSGEMQQALEKGRAGTPQMTTAASPMV